MIIHGWPTHARPARRIEAPFISRQICSTALSKDAFPTSPACVAGRTNSFRLPKQAQVYSVSFQAQIRLSFALRSEAA